MDPTFFYCVMTVLPGGATAYRDGSCVAKNNHLDIDALRLKVAAEFDPPRSPEQVVFLSLTKIS